MPCLEETRSFEALLVLSAFGQHRLDIKGLFLPVLMSSLGVGESSLFTKQKLLPADTIFNLQSGDMWRLGLELVDLKGLESDGADIGDVGEVGPLDLDVEL
jgi:hypothetical protein